MNKLAEIMSSLRPPMVGKPMKLPTSARGKTPAASSPTSRGLGDKMRSETSHALEAGLKTAMFKTGLEDLVKLSGWFGGGGAVAPPVARIAPTSGMKRYPVTPAAHPATPTATTLPATDMHPAAQVAPLPAGGTAGGQAPAKFRFPIGKTLGLAGLGAAGAAAYGLHRQNVEDREKNPLVYAPMSGSFMQ